MTTTPDNSEILVTANRFAAPVPAGGNLEGQSYVENRHWGWLIVTGLRQGHLYCTPRADRIATFFRSAAKPFQAFPLVEAGFAGLLTTEELAITCASHTGSADHLRLAAAILEKASLPESALQCGPHLPSDPAMLESLRREQREPTPLYNNCSGKHASMLFYCKQAGLDTSTYLNPDHPLQQRILETLKRWSGLDEIPVAVDGCGAPVFYMPLSAMARLFAALGSVSEFAPLAKAMTSYPVIVGGEGRIDTVLMQTSQGKLLAKVGAEGVIGVSKVDSGEGLALKIADGSNDVRNLAIVEILLRLGWLSKSEANDARLLSYRNLDRTNTQNKAVGRFEIHFDPDQARVRSAHTQTSQTESLQEGYPY